MRKKIAWMMCGVLTLGMIGCGNAQKDSAGGAGTEPENQAETDQSGQDTAEGEEAEASGTEETDYDGVEFRIAWWGGDTRNTQTVDIIENFEKQYKNLKIDVEYGEFGDYFTKLTTQATAGNLPDVYMMDISRINEFVEAGQMQQLDSYIADGTIDLSDVDDSFTSGGIVGDGMYAITTGINSPCFFYDPAVLEEAGLTLSEAPTWGELTEVIKTVYEKTGNRAYMAPNGEAFSIYLRSIGKSVYSEDRTSFGFDPEDLTAFLEIFSDIYESGAAPTSVEYEGEVETCMQDGNQIWMKMWEDGFSNALSGKEEENGKRLYMGCYPSADDNVGSGTYLKPVMLWGISATSENKDLAAEFINYFVNDPYVYEVCGMDRGVPISAAMRDQVSESADETGKYMLNFINYLSDGVATAISPPAPAGGAEASAFLGELYEQVFYGQMEKSEIGAAAEEAVEQGNEILAKGGTQE